MLPDEPVSELESDVPYLGDVYEHAFRSVRERTREGAIFKVALAEVWSHLDERDKERPDYQLYRGIGIFKNPPPPDGWPQPSLDLLERALYHDCAKVREGGVVLAPVLLTSSRLRSDTRQELRETLRTGAIQLIERRDHPRPVALELSRLLLTLYGFSSRPELTEFWQEYQERIHPVEEPSSALVDRAREVVLALLDTTEQLLSALCEGWEDNAPFDFGRATLERPRVTPIHAYFNHRALWSALKSPSIILEELLKVDADPVLQGQLARLSLLRFWLGEQIAVSDLRSSIETRRKRGAELLFTDVIPDLGRAQKFSARAGDRLRSASLACVYLWLTRGQDSLTRRALAVTARSSGFLVPRDARGYQHRDEFILRANVDLVDEGALQRLREHYGAPEKDPEELVLRLRSDARSDPKGLTPVLLLDGAGVASDLYLIPIASRLLRAALAAEPSQPGCPEIDVARVLARLAERGSRMAAQLPFALNVELFNKSQEGVRTAFSRVSLDIWSSEGLIRLHELVTGRTSVTARYRRDHDAGERILNQYHGLLTEDEMAQAFLEMDERAVTRGPTAVSLEQIGRAIKKHGSPLAISMMERNSGLHLFAVDHRGNCEHRELLNWSPTDAGNRVEEFRSHWENNIEFFPGDAFKLLGEGIHALGDRLDWDHRSLVLSVPNVLASLPWNLIVGNWWPDPISRPVASLVPGLAWLGLHGLRQESGVVFKVDRADEFIAGVLDEFDGLLPDDRSALSALVVIAHGRVTKGSRLPSIALGGEDLSFPDLMALFRRRIGVFHVCHGGHIPRGLATPLGDVGGVVTLALSLGCEALLAPVVPVRAAHESLVLHRSLFDSRPTTVGEAYRFALEEEPRVALYNLWGAIDQPLRRSFPGETDKWLDATVYGHDEETVSIPDEEAHATSMNHAEGGEPRGSWPRRLPPRRSAGAAGEGLTPEIS